MIVLTPDPKTYGFEFGFTNYSKKKKNGITENHRIVRVIAQRLDIILNKDVYRLQPLVLYDSIFL